MTEHAVGLAVWIEASVDYFCRIDITLFSSENWGAVAVVRLKADTVAVAYRDVRTRNSKAIKHRAVWSIIPSGAVNA